MTTNLFIGLLSGTSLDAIDAVLVSIDQHGAIEQKHALNHPIPDTLKKQCADLFSPGTNELIRYGIADREFAAVCADAVQRLLYEAQVSAEQVTAIGSHGQTVRHHPEISPGFTFQLGCPHTLAVKTNIPVAAQFRHRDIALGGEGAPLAPLLHQHLFGSTYESRAIVNIGGIANVSVLPPADSGKPVTGFDTGPGNSLMDAWIQEWQGQAYDKSGDWAASGQVSQQLLKKMLSEPYFDRPAPKSTGKELFNLRWLENQLGDLELPAADVQATLLELSVITINQAIPDDVKTAYVCGGGAHNAHLMYRLQAANPEVQWLSTEVLGIEPDWVEAVLFAWLAWRQWSGSAGNVPEVTGAMRATLPGAWFPADSDL